MLIFASLEVVTPFLLWASQLNWVYLSTPAKDRLALSPQCKFFVKETPLKVKSLLNIWTMCSYLSVLEHADHTFRSRLINNTFFGGGVSNINLREKCHVSLKREARHIWIWLTSLLYLKAPHTSVLHSASAKFLQWKRLTMAFTVFWVLGLLLNNVSFVRCFSLSPCQRPGSEASRRALYFSLQNNTSPNESWVSNSN